MAKSNPIFKNTFAPHVDNHELTLDALILGLMHGVFHYDGLPDNIKSAVSEEMKRGFPK